MEYILSGDPLHVGYILQENARRVALGLVKFTPATTENSVHYVSATDTKTVTAVDTKTVETASKATATAKKTVKKSTDTTD